MTIDPSRISLNFIEKDIVDEEPQQDAKPVAKPDVKVEQQVEEPEEPQVQEVKEVKKTSRISGFLREAQPDCKPLDPKIAIAATAIWTFLLTSI